MADPDALAMDTSANAPQNCDKGCHPAADSKQNGDPQGDGKVRNRNTGER